MSLLQRKLTWPLGSWAFFKPVFSRQHWLGWKFSKKCLDPTEKQIRWKNMHHYRWWFEIFFGIFTPKIGEDEPNLTCAYLFKWVVWNHQLDHQRITELERHSLQLTSVEQKEAPQSLNGWVTHEHVLEIGWPVFLKGALFNDLDDLVSGRGAVVIYFSPGRSWPSSATFGGMTGRTIRNSARRSIEHVTARSLMPFREHAWMSGLKPGSGLLDDFWCFEDSNITATIRLRLPC